MSEFRVAYDNTFAVNWFFTFKKAVKIFSIFLLSYIISSDSEDKEFQLIGTII